MATTPAPTAFHVLLDQGSGLYVNRVGDHGWSVDVFDVDWQPGEDPVYHAFYATAEEALVDAGSWRFWPGEEITVVR